MVENSSKCVFGADFNAGPSKGQSLFFLLGLKLVKLSILLMLFIQFVQGHRSEQSKGFCRNQLPVVVQSYRSNKEIHTAEWFPSYSIVLPTSQVFRSGYIKWKSVLYFFYKIILDNTQRGNDGKCGLLSHQRFIYSHLKWFSS